MKIAVFAIAALLAYCGAQASEVYKVRLTRVDQDVYRIDYGNTYVKTSYCYQIGIAEEAVLILKIQPFQGSIAIGKIVFTSGWTTCQVDTVFTANQ